MRMTLRDALGFFAVTAAALAAAATAAIPRPPCDSNPHRELTTWTLFEPPTARSIETSSTRRGCAQLTAWVAKSGRDGLALTVEAQPHSDAPCPIRIATVILRTGHQQTEAKGTSLTLADGETARVYLPLFFENTRAWDEGDHRAVATVHFGDDDKPWQLELAQLPATTACGERAPDGTREPILRVRP